MRLRFVIFVFLLAGLSGFGQQQGNQQTGQSGQQSSQSNAKQQDGKPSPADANPFPEEQSRKAADAANSGSSSAPKGDTPGFSSSHVDMKPLDENADRESRISDGAGGYIHSPELAAKDDKVGRYYLQNGDFKGAYDRYKEATLVAPEDGEAVFGLAESARGLHLTQDAVNNYMLYLDAFPEGKRSKDARKALVAIGHPAKK